MNDDSKTIEKPGADSEQTLSRSPFDPLRESTGGDSNTSPGVGEDDGPPALDPYRYESIELLGEGGMGRVYKVFDRLLHRYVALKFLRSDDPELARRILQEARAQARIEHEHVCKIYEIASAEGRPFISMQYIEGQSLKEARADMTLAQKIQAIEQVCLAVHEAHRRGLLHRDIKPANILVDEQEDGSYKPHIMDFGLAREMDNGVLNGAGGVVGTPKYMAPEQARGTPQGTDRRADVYSLGATLYELLTGKPPFEGKSTADILRQVQWDEPVPPRVYDENLPRDLETITLKCLEKEPARRYDSAKALAEDLRRYLDGDPILARQADWHYRAWKKLRKHKSWIALWLLVVLTACVFGTLALKERWAAAEQARLAQRFGQDVQRMDSVARYAALGPLHDLGVEREALQARIREIHAQMERLGSVAQGPGHYALGRGYLALANLDEARLALSQAWELGYREPEVAYALGVTLGEFYSRELRGLDRIRDPEEQERLSQELRREYRDPALNLLKISGSKFSMDSPRYGEGLIALYEGRYEDALRLADQAFREVPWLFEAKKLEGDAYFARGTELLAALPEQGLQDIEMAGMAYRKALSVARSDPGLYTAECRRLFSVLEFERRGGEDVKAVFEEGTAACRAALQADSKSAEAYQMLCRFYFSRGMVENGQDIDPQGSLDEAIRMGRQALELNPGEISAGVDLSGAILARADLESRRSRNPLPFVRQAIEILQAALDRAPTSISILGNIAVAYHIQADYEEGRGLDPRRSRQRSIELLRQALGFNPKAAWIHSNLGMAYSALCEYDSLHGVEPGSACEQAQASAEKALDMAPDSPDLYHLIGSIHASVARFEMSQGQDPLLSMTKAREAYAQALRLNPRRAATQLSLGLLYRLWAVQHLRQKLPAEQEFEQASSLLRQAVSERQKFAEAYRALGWILLTETGTPSLPSTRLEALLKEARSALDQALALEPADPKGWRLLAALELAEARTRSQPGATLERARAALVRLGALPRSQAQSELPSPIGVPSRAELESQLGEFTRPASGS